MLTHPPLISSWGLNTIEPSVALGMIRELRHHGHDTGTSMGNKAQVKGPMGNFPAFILFGSGQPGHLGEESFEPAQFICLEERNGQTNGQCFQTDAHRIQLLEIGKGETGHTDTVVRFGLHQSLTLQHTQRLAYMIFSVATSIAFLSSLMTLEPGDVVTTGTPDGVGPIQAGDTVEIEVEGVGVLRNPVVKAG